MYIVYFHTCKQEPSIHSFPLTINLIIETFILPFDLIQIINLQKILRRIYTKTGNRISGKS